MHPNEGKLAVEAVLHRCRPARVVYGPNYWQWFAHHQRHGTLPAEIEHIRTQLELLEYLDVDVFSRNTYCDQRRCWFGGLCDIVWDGVRVTETETPIGADLVIDRTFHTPAGDLRERQRHMHDQSTLVQQKFIVDDYANQLGQYAQLVAARGWRFIPDRYQRAQRQVGGRGVVIAGELYSPLKMLHLDMGPQDTTYFLMDQPDRARELLAMHEAAQLDLVRQMLAAGVPAMMAMDNLDTVFHTPAYVEQYSASFYQRASHMCHDNGSTFFIHACGRQRANLKLIASLGVDGLEGVAYPPLGDVELDEALAATGERFIVTGGISAAETDRLATRDAVYQYVGNLFSRLRPFTHRFVFAASCNTAITATWEQLVWFRDAWRDLA